MGTNVESLEHKPDSQLQRFSAQSSPRCICIPPDSPTQIILKQTWTSYYFTHKYFGMHLQKMNALKKQTHNYHTINLNNLDLNNLAVIP